MAAVQRVTHGTSPQKSDPEPAAPQKEGPSEEEVLRLQERCEEQARQLELMRVELKKTTLGLEAFAICTQHLCLQVTHTTANSLAWRGVFTVWGVIMGTDINNFTE